MYYPTTSFQVYSQLEDETSHVTQTAWAMLTLMAARYHEIDPRPLHRAAACLARQQVRAADHPSMRLALAALRSIRAISLLA